MNKYISLQGAIASGLVGAACAASESPADVSRNAPGRPDVGGAPTAIALELRDNFPFFMANVDGADVKLKFDLGSSSELLLQQGIVDQIKATPTNESSRFQGVDGVFESAHYKVQRVQIGVAVFRDVRTTIDGPRPGYEPGTFSQGLLGTGLLKEYVVVLDYPKQTMKLLSRAGEGGSGSCEGTVVPFSQSSPKWRGEPVTDVQTDLGPLTLWWDTGAPASILRNGLFNDGNAHAAKDTVSLTRLVLGGRDFGPWRFDVWEMSLPGFDGFIGYDFFSKHVVCVDFPNSRIIISL